MPRDPLAGNVSQELLLRDQEISHLRAALAVAGQKQKETEAEFGEMIEQQASSDAQAGEELAVMQERLKAVCWSHMLISCRLGSFLQDNCDLLRVCVSLFFS